MERKNSNGSLKDYLPPSLVTMSEIAQSSLTSSFNTLLSSKRLPEHPTPPHLISLYLNQLSMTDSNNFSHKVGVGEREARISSHLLHQRYFGLLHGVGRSGELNTIQPKSAGSSVLQKLVHHLAKDAVERMGLRFGEQGDLLIMPICTGMGLMMALGTLRNKKKEAKKVIFLRVDQKSCLKSISAAGLQPIVIHTKPCVSSPHPNPESSGQNRDSIKTLEQRELKTNPDAEPSEGKTANSDHLHRNLTVPALETDLSSLEDLLKNSEQGEFLCIMSNTSCFAPREPDDVIAVGKLARKFGLFHIVNNAYGVQCSKTCEMLRQACSLNLVDYIVQSTDKNFLVPVGGCVVISPSRKQIEELNLSYPGRASANAVIDLFISLLSMGKSGLVEKLKTRKECWQHLKAKMLGFCERQGEKLIDNKRNKISIAVTLSRLGNRSKEFGAWLFNQGVMGARVVSSGPEKSVGGVQLKNFEGHTNEDYSGFPYVTIAAAIGVERSEIERFSELFEKTYLNFLKKIEKSKNVQVENIHSKEIAELKDDPERQEEHPNDNYQDEEE